MLKKIIAIMLVIGCLSVSFSCKKKTQEESLPPVEIKNVILLIGDGMGPNQIKAGELYKREKLYMQKMSQAVKVDTNSYYGDTTDSAAAATALATGNLTSNGFVGISARGEELPTLVDIAHNLGKRTGVITTEELYGATPMGFSAHSDSRNKKEELMLSAARTSNVNLFASYTLPSPDRYFIDEFVANGYEIVSHPANISESTSEKIFGDYRILAGAESMTISDIALALDGLVSEALDYLSQDEDGFFLMVEGAHIDHGGHQNKIEYMLSELLAFDDMVKYVVEWSKKRRDTLVLVTADHETGGLILNPDAKYGELFDYDYDTNTYNNFRWSTTGHTNTKVWLFVHGAKIDFKAYSTFEDKALIKNADVFSIANAYLTGNKK